MNYVLNGNFLHIYIKIHLNETIIQPDTQYKTYSTPFNKEYESFGELRITEPVTMYVTCQQVAICKTRKK